MIAAFLDRLKSLDSQPEIDELCREEIALLEEGYLQATIGKNYIGKYRKAIHDATEDGTLPLTENTLLDYDYTKRDGAIEHFRGHYAYRQFKYDEEYNAIAEADNERNNQKQDNLQPVAIDAYFEKAIELLGSNQFNELAAAIGALTGRRFSEVMQNQFELTEHPYKLRFAGQLKKKNPEEYETLCLIPADQMWEAIERFRRLDRTQELQGLSPQKLNSLANKPIQRTVQDEFGAEAIVPVLEGEKAVTIHNLRAIYAVLAIHFFCPPSKADHRFLQEQLGHIIGKRNLAKLRNSPSTAHYFHYYLVDANSQHIGSKGVKLVELPAIEAIQTESESITEPEIPAINEPTTEPTPAVEPSIEAIAPDATEVATTPIDTALEIKAADQDTATIAVEPEATPEPETESGITPSKEVSPELPEITAAEEAADPAPAPAEPTLIPSLEPNFMESLAELNAELRQTLGFLRRQAEKQERQLEALQSERDRLALDLQMVREQLSEAESAKTQRETEAEPLHQRIAQLEAENQDQRDQLARVYRAMGVNPAQLAPSTPTETEPPPALTIEPTPAPAIATTPTPTPATAPASDSTPVTVPPAKSEAKSSGVKASSKRGRKASAQGKLGAAVNFIQEYNDSAADTKRWALSQALIAALTGGNPTLTVKPFWTEEKADAEAYNARMGFPNAAQHNQRRMKEELAQLEADQDEKPTPKQVMQSLREEFDIWFDAQPQPDRTST